MDNKIEKNISDNYNKKKKKEPYSNLNELNEICKKSQMINQQIKNTNLKK